MKNIFTVNGTLEFDHDGEICTFTKVTRAIDADDAKRICFKLYGDPCVEVNILDVQEGVNL